MCKHRCDRGMSRSVIVSRSNACAEVKTTRTTCHGWELPNKHEVLECSLVFVPLYAPTSSWSSCSCGSTEAHVSPSISLAPNSHSTARLRLRKVSRVDPD